VRPDVRPTPAESEHADAEHNTEKAKTKSKEDC